MPSGAKATANPGRCCQVQVVRFQVPGAKSQVLDSRCKVPGARIQVQSARCQIPGAKYLVPGEKIRGCHTLPQILRSLTHVDQIQQILQKIFYHLAIFNFEEEIPMGGNVAYFGDLEVLYCGGKRTDRCHIGGQTLELGGISINVFSSFHWIV